MEEKERVEEEQRLEMERVEEEQRLEREERERLEEKDRLERERVALEAERLEREERERLEEKDRLERERVALEAERLEREERERSEKEQEALDRLEKEKEEYDRMNKERVENRVVRGLQSPERIDEEVSFSSEEEMSDDCVGAALVEHGERSHRKRKTTTTLSRLVQGYVMNWRPRKNRRYRHAIFDYVRLNTNFPPRRHHIIDIEEDPVMLSCDGHIARLSLCTGIGLSRG